MIHQLKKWKQLNFLAKKIDSNLNLEAHVQCIMPKLSSACFAVRAVTSLMNTETLKLVCSAYFHSIMSYRLIFWGKFNRQQKSNLHPKKNHQNNVSC
jgi:hypothetical protein